MYERRGRGGEQERERGGGEREGIGQELGRERERTERFAMELSQRGNSGRPSPILRGTEIGDFRSS